MAKKELSYAEAMAEIETILDAMNSEDNDIDSLASQVERAGELIKLCRGKLLKAEEDVRKALGDE